MKTLSLYIHIPFCIKKCYYCNFTSFTNMNHRIEDYIKSLINELALYKDRVKDYTIKSIFIGGGTPSAIDAKHIYKILNYIRENYKLDQDNEITIESNPASLSREKIKIYKESGINRISIGLQTLDDNLLKSIGRSHRAEDFYKSYEDIRQIGIENINVDLIFGLPGQDLKLVIDSLKKVIDLKVKHISYYGLILEEDTYFYKLYKEGKLILADEEEERKMYYEASEYLISHGYNHYEISNYALDAYECRHNLVYWDLKPYLGIGLNSHSFFQGVRFFNSSDLESYISQLNKDILPIEASEEIDINTEIEEFCIFGIRKTRGIDKKEFKDRFGKEIESIYGDIIGKHVKNGLVKNNADFLFLTRKGLDLANQVEVDFLRD